MDGKRIIGIVHRIKASAQGEARPTMVYISGESSYELKLEDEQAELDFVLGRYETNLKKKGKKAIPAKEGLRAGDTVAMTFGGSGDRLALVVCRQLRKIGGKVARISSHELKREREDAKKDGDNVLLAMLYEAKPELFTVMADRDMDLIQVREKFFARQDAMTARMGCEARLRQRFIGRVFLKDMYPEGKIEDEYAKLKASDSILRAIMAEEAGCEKEIKAAVRKLPVWAGIFEPIEGVGEMIAARLIVAIGDIRRFETKHKLKKFCGAHVLPDGRFPRRRNGELANWHPQARQALFLLGDQFNRRPKSIWGQKLLENKAKFRSKYPEPIESAGAGGKKTKKYTDMHIHRMATWRTITKFVEWLFREWSRLENPATEAEKKAA